MFLRHGNTFLSREPKVSSFVISICKAAISAQIRFVIPCLETITIKIATREKRNKGIRWRVRADSKIPGNWQTFLRVAENKKEHFSYLADRVITIGAENGEVISTNEDTVICNTERVLVDLSPCQQEEADTRLLLLHAADPAKRGCTKVMVRTDVVVIAIAHFHLMSLSLIFNL